MLFIYALAIWVVGRFVLDVILTYLEG